MTKHRPALTPYRALARIADLIGWDGCAAVCEKSEWTMRKYADPDTEREISLRDAIRLDTAFQRAGGEGAPLFEAYATRLEIERQSPGNPDCMVGLAREAAREGGEAIDAMLSLLNGGNTQTALKEVEEALASFGKAAAALKRVI
ncbi:hypothetical protein [Asticcacaulis sp.]|uniref:hypothetical protein n=1 Tax=Asticcacaulis sp. TaxID=1872648 RepID=UPI0039193DF7